MSAQEVAFKLIQYGKMSVRTAHDCERSRGVVWAQFLLVSETSWPDSLDAEIAQSPHAGGQASSSWYTIQGFRVGIVLCT